MISGLLVAGSPPCSVSGPILKIPAPLSFWGGVSPEDGRLADPRAGHLGISVAGTVLCIARLRGSSSASSVLLELIYKGLAPAAIILDVPDAILALAVFVAREMHWPAPPILHLSAMAQNALPDTGILNVDVEGGISVGRISS